VPFPPASCLLLLLLLRLLLLFLLPTCFYSAPIRITLRNSANTDMRRRRRRRGELENSEKETEAS